MPVKRKVTDSTTITTTKSKGKGKDKGLPVGVSVEKSGSDQPSHDCVEDNVYTHNESKSHVHFDGPVVCDMNEPIVMQLAINPTRIDELISGEDINSILTYKPIVTEPQPYSPYNRFASDHDHVQIEESTVTTQPTIDVSHDFAKHPFLQSQSSHINMNAPHQTNITNNNNNGKQHHDIKCFWCCHNIVDVEYGMPVRYDVIHESFTVFGSFCSLECTSAYNCSINMGSNRVWEINSWIQLLGQKYGFTQPIRPAPPRYILKMFNGTVDIAEFRSMHKGLSQTCVMNIPPFIHITSQMELINTSFLDSLKDKNKDKDRDKDRDREKDPKDVDEKEKEKDRDKEPTVFRTPYRSIERNMNLKFEQV